MSDVVLFSAQWCTNCPGVKRALDAAGVGYTVLDIDEATEDAMAHNVRGLPTVIHFSEGGVELQRFTGAQAATQSVKYFKDLGLTQDT